MPRSKRDKKISLTKTKPKGLQFKQHLVDDIRSNIKKYKNLFLISVENMRTVHLQEVRKQWPHSKFQFGKSRVMRLALGATKDEEQEPGLSQFANRITGPRGLLFTNKKKEAVIQWFDNFVEAEYARTGHKCTRTVTLPADYKLKFISSMEPELRKLGLPTELKNGVIFLRDEHVVCTEGQILNSNQAKILKLMGEYMAEFKLKAHCMWSKKNGFESFDAENESPLEDSVVQDADENEDNLMDEDDDSLLDEDVG